MIYLTHNPIPKRYRSTEKSKWSWINWYINRGRFPLGIPDREVYKLLRMNSWRRAK